MLGHRRRRLQPAQDPDGDHVSNLCGFQFNRRHSRLLPRVTVEFGSNGSKNNRPALNNNGGKIKVIRKLNWEYTVLSNTQGMAAITKHQVTSRDLM